MLGELGRALAPFGLNLIGVATVHDYDAIVPPSHRLGSVRLGSASPAAIVVVGNGGGAFWGAYREHVAADPALGAAAHPLDAFTAQVMESVAMPAIARLGVRAELRLPFRSTTPPLSFVHLAEAAGLGRRSLLGVLVHPEFGPWMALRGALFIDAAVTAPRPAAGFDPCPACRDRPCLAACPGAAVTHPGGWDVPRCIDFRIGCGSANPCEDRCHARVACVYGRTYRYPEDALAYHQRRAFAVMRGAR